MNSRLINSFAKVAAISMRNRALTTKTTINIACKQTLNLNLRYTIPCVRNFGAAAGKDEPFLDPKVVTERIIEVIKNFEKIQKAKVTASARFKEDLDLDSLDAVEVVMAIEEEFGLEIPDSEADKITSIAEAVSYVSAHPMAK